MGLRRPLPTIFCIAALAVAVSGFGFAYPGARNAYAATLPEGSSADASGAASDQDSGAAQDSWSSSEGAADAGVQECCAAASDQAGDGTAENSGQASDGLAQDSGSSEGTADSNIQDGDEDASGEVSDPATASENPTGDTEAGATDASGGATDGDGQSAQAGQANESDKTAQKTPATKEAGKKKSTTPQKPRTARNNGGAVTAQVAGSRPGPARGVDFNADKRDELAVFYDYGNADTGLWLFKPNGSGYDSPQKAWSSGGGNWDWTRSKTTAVDYNGDGKTEIAVLYDYGNATTGLWLFRPTAAGYGAPERTWFSGGGNWDWTRSKITPLDFNKDGKTELGVLYDYGNATTGLWMFRPTAAGYSAPERTWFSGGGNWDWTRSKITGVDANGDGKTELSVLYNYDNSTTGLWLFQPNASGYSAPERTWFSGGGNWDWNRSKISVADVNQDGKTELAVLYDYSDTNTGILIFDPTGTGFSNPHGAWSSGAGNWDWTRSKLTAVDFNQDGKTELAVFYDYGNATTGLLLFTPEGAGFANPFRAWFSGGGNWEAVRSKVVKADYFKPTLTVLSVDWLDVNLSTQTLSAFGSAVNEIDEGYRVNVQDIVVFAALTATGKPGWETPTGVYHVLAKDRSVDMRSGADWSEQYDVPGVPNVLWFIDRVYAIHGAYWRVDFGQPASHGCVNLSVADSDWVFEHAPEGMMINIHY